MPSFIQYNTEDPDVTLPVLLDGEQRTLRIVEHGTTGYRYMHIYDEEGNPLALGQAILPRWPIAGGLRAVAPGLIASVDGAALFYADAEEVREIRDIPDPAREGIRTGGTAPVYLTGTMYDLWRALAGIDLESDDEDLVLWGNGNPFTSASMDYDPETFEIVDWLSDDTDNRIVFNAVTPTAEPLAVTPPNDDLFGGNGYIRFRWSATYVGGRSAATSADNWALCLVFAPGDIAAKIANTTGTKFWWVEYDPSTSTITAYTQGDISQTVTAGGILPDVPVAMLLRRMGTALELWINGELVDDITLTGTMAAEDGDIVLGANEPSYSMALAYYLEWSSDSPFHGPFSPRRVRDLFRLIRSFTRVG